VTSVEARERSITVLRGISRRTRRAVPVAVLVIAGLVVADATAAGASPPHGGAAIATANPPVITEVFKPVLPCNANTTVGMEGCGEHKVLSADRQLNADVKVIFNLTSASSRQDFVVAQAKWLAYRTADCQSQSDVYHGGTEQPVVYVYCLAADDGARRQDLKGFFRALTQGLTTVPRFP
jgi:uncharacterized protein YecT (DUF1311 family)